MLRPYQSLLASSRAARKRSAREDRHKAVARLVRFAFRVAANVIATGVDLVVLCGAPLAYLAASFAVLDLPARWAFGPTVFNGRTFAIFAAALAVCALGIVRALQGAQPVAPVRPKFARTMLGLSWAAGLLLTVADLAG